MKPKSILDNFPVDDSEWRVRKPPQGGSSTAGQLGIVGSCPQCGSPIYGNQIYHQKQLRDEVPVVYHSCTCFPQNKSFDDLKQTK